MKKALRVMGYMVVVVTLILSAALFRNCLLKKQKLQEENNLENITDEVIPEEDLVKKQYEQNLAKTEGFKSSINSQTELIVLTIADKYVIGHDKTPQNSKMTEWLFDSNICIEVRYEAIFSIPTSAILVKQDESGNPITHYDISKMSVKSINIKNLITKTDKGILASDYSPSEVAALTLVATDQIKECISANEMFMFMAEQNLVNYLELQSLKANIFNMKIISASFV